MTTYIALSAGHAMAQEFEPERLKNGVSLPADMPRVYVGDFSIASLPDSRVHILDGRNGKYVGVIDSGMGGQFAISPDRKRVYIATTYMTRHTHGERHDTMEVYDADSLRMTGDGALPNKKAQAAFMQNLALTSHDGRYLFVQNATPASSITVLDVQQDNKVVAEVPTPGCYGIYPSQTEALRISTLCGDGKLATVTLDAVGKVTERRVSDKFFDATSDPVYVPGPTFEQRYYFLSFHGKLHRVDLRGATPVVEQSLSFVTDADRKQGWRPGGYQAFTIDERRKRVYVGMHPKGQEGTHKFPAKEIWSVDLGTGKRLARTKSRNAIALQVAKSGPDHLYALDGVTNQVVGYALASMRQVFVSDPVGSAPLQLEAP
ncbi:amine dehydrogenase large subunit [Massilia sp. METH4]|uniref:amine dehydrogenase large subunit n=1 Tax=Massilia sp. METH4 TaxID=3123041 RepID=UPI0030CFB57A